MIVKKVLGIFFVLALSLTVVEAQAVNSSPHSQGGLIWELLSRINQISLLSQAGCSTNTPPAPSISVPVNNFSGVVGTPVSFSGSATDSGGSISITSYSWNFGDSTSAGGTSANHVYATPGQKTVTLTANDWCGASGSTNISITINSSTPTNAPASVNAGADQNISSLGFPTVNLNAAVTDDGLPNPPGALTYTWQQVSGPAGSVFTGASTLNPSVALMGFGTYVFRLTVWDGAVQSYDEVSVTANQSANNPPTVNAGTDQSVVFPASATLSGSVSDDNSANPYRVWTKTSGPGTVTFSSPSSNSPLATFSGVGVYVLRLTANDGFLESFDEVTVTVNSQTNTAPTASAGSDRSVTGSTGPFVFTINNTASVYDDGLPNPPGSVTQTWTKVSGPGTVTFTPSNTTLRPTVSLSLAGTYVLRLTASDSVLSDDDEMTVTVNQPNNTPTVDAGPNRTIYSYQTNSASLDGTVNDDGLPNPPGALATTWTKVSGPGTVTFANASSVDTTATFSQAGTYGLRLTVSDGSLSANDTMTVFYWQNNPPTANAGPDQNLSFPQAPAIVPLSPSASNPDGLPVGGQLHFDWIKVSGPGNATFSNSGGTWPPNSSPSVTLSQFGSYILRLLISDGSTSLGGLSSSDDVAITISSGGNVNTPPTVNAVAEPAIITLPTSQVLLNGTVADNNLSLVSYLWTKVSGPTTGSTIVSPTQVDTNVTFTQAGTYKFKLTVNDSGVPPFNNISSPEVTVTVNPVNQCAGNLPPLVSAGPDRTATAGVLITLTGSSSDPNGNNTITNHAWNFGDGSATFNAPNAVAMHTFAVAGTYNVTLTVTDGCHSVSDETQVVVAPPQPSNQAPQAGLLTANPSVLALPLNTLNLSVPITDDLLPAPHSVTTTWSQVSGPATGTTFNPPVSQSALASFTATTAVTLPSVSGDYVFRASISDGSGLPAVIREVTVALGPPVAGPCDNNQAPTANLTGPTTGLVGQTLTFSADGSTTGSNGMNENGQSLNGYWFNWGTGFTGWQTSSTLERVFTSVGTYVIKLWVRDTCATNNVSPVDELSLIVNSSGPSNTAPVISGFTADQFSVTLPNRTVTLSAQISDDRLPNPPAQITVDWSQVGGTEITTFTNDPQVNSTGNFTATSVATLPNVPGLYILQVSAADGSALPAATSQILVMVNSPLPTNQPPVVTASAMPAEISLPLNQVALAGNYTDDNLPTGRTITTTWSVDEAPQGSFVLFGNPAALNTTATFSPVAGTYKLKLTATEFLNGSPVLSGVSVATVLVNPITDPCIGNTPPSANAGFDQSVAEDSLVSFNGTLSADVGGSISTYSWNFGDGGTGSGATPTHIYTTSGTYVATLTVTDNCGATHSDTATIVVTSSAPAQIPPRVNAGVDQFNLSFPTTVSLSGTVSGFPSGYSKLWTKVAGPGTVSFSSPNSLQTTATFSSAGFYALKLTVTSGSLVVSDIVEVIFNQAVSVSAGVDRSLNLATSNHQGSLTFDASVTASDPSPLSYSWSQVSGPQALTITNSQVLDATVSANKAGTYVLRLTVSGPGVVPSNDTVTLSVRDLEAGSNQNIVLPASVALSGTASNFPTGTTYQWTQFSGPAGGSAFSSQNSLNTNVSFSQSGTYQLRLTATPLGESPIYDTVQVGVAVVGSLGVDAGSDQLNTTFTSPSVTRNLNGVVVNAPVGTTYKWTKASGPSGGAQPTFSPSDVVLNPVVTLYQTGSYTFQLKATPPSGLAVLDTVSITFNVNPTNISVEASPNYLTWPQNSTNLNINFSDSNPESVSGLWTQFQGPIGQASFASPNSFDTTVTFGQVGNYDLRMTIDDGLAYDPQITREVKVYPACGVGNQKPTAFASADQWVQVNHGVALSPFSSVGIGSAGYTPSTDSDGVITSYYWDFGDGSFSVEGSTNHSYTQVGTYNATLTVADNCGLIDTEEVVVHVVPVNPGAFNPVLKSYRLEAYHPATGEEVWTELSGSVVSVETGDLLRLDLLSGAGGIGLSTWTIGNQNVEITQSGLVQKVKFLSPSLLTNPASVMVYPDDYSSSVVLSKNFDVNNVMDEVGVGPGIHLSAREMTVNENGSLAWAIHSEPNPCTPGDTFGPQCMTLTQLDLSDEDNITVNEYMPNTISNPTSLAYSHDHLYLRDGINIKVFGVSANSAPQYQGTYNLGNSSTGGVYKGVAARGQVLFSTAGNLGLKVLDLRQTPTLSLLGQTSLPGGEVANVLFLDGNKLYVGGANNKVHIFDISCLGDLEAPSACNPNIIGSVDVGSNISFLAKTGFGGHDYVLVYTYSGVKVYDITNLGQIVQVGEFSPYQVFGANATGVLAFGNKLYFGFSPTNLNYGTSVARINLANPSEIYAMEWISTLTAGGNKQMIHQNGKLYVTSDTNDIIILDLLNE